MCWPWATLNLDSGIYCFLSNKPMEVTSTNPLNIQLATFARNLEWKLQKQNEEKQSELSKRKELCQTKERPLSISSLYYSGPAVSSSCNECHPNSTSIFQKSFNVLTLKDLLHKPCIPIMKQVVSKISSVSTIMKQVRSK
uniref:Uncharacterized protein n=1 Tax=Cacopsylla melanoneura TaxID=428564 RepID=A0A8D8SFG4_9HEMI